MKHAINIWLFLFDATVYLDACNPLDYLVKIKHTEIKLYHGKAEFCFVKRTFVDAGIHFVG